VAAPRARIRLGADTPLRGVRAFIIMQALGALGEDRTREPPIEQIQADGFDTDFAVRVVSTSPADRRSRA
jgi:hypothetical protein